MKNLGLLLLVKDTKFESKSQPLLRWRRHWGHCFYWSKIQNLKANHNLPEPSGFLSPIAFTGQRYKIWKQITTYAPRYYSYKNCFYWSKIQNLKANHNHRSSATVNANIAFTGQRYKIWKQITTYLQSLRDAKYCFYWSKIQNLKANHNTLTYDDKHVPIAFTGQRYKIWKQITTLLLDL